MTNKRTTRPAGRGTKARARSKADTKTVRKKTVRKAVRKVAGKAVTRTKPATKPAHKPARGDARNDAPALASLAHEIRTSLTGILALSELLTTATLEERERRWALAVKSTAEHLASLTSLIVDSAKAEHGSLTLRPREFRIRPLVRALADSLAARAEVKGLTAQITIAPDIPERLLGDPERLRAALENLIDNAVKFTPAGAISLAVAARRRGAQRLLLTFTLTDTGIGMTAPEIRRLLRPFTQANKDIGRRFGGAGLGLAFVKRIAVEMGGDLKIESRPEHGTRFSLSVVVAVAPHGADENETRDDAPAGAVRPLAILCAEDNPYGRVIINTILTELGHRVEFVGTGTAVVAAAARGHHDVILMDIMLPEVDGLEATRRVRALPEGARDTPIIGISGRSAAGDEQRARAAGMNFYLTKPLSPSALAAALAAVRRGEGLIRNDADRVAEKIVLP